MLKNFFLFFSIFLSFQAYSQNNQITGTVLELTNHKPVFEGAVILIRSKDSVLVKDSRTDEHGYFNVKNIPAGKYILYVTFPDYVDLVREFNVLPQQNLALGELNLIQSSTLLKDVIISSKKISIRLRGDTTEFNAGSYKLLPNASVEDLLKKIPGLQVDNKGNITAQGKNVTKVLVDGEEFFGDDPTLVTKNMQADMVDKVQIYEKKSDQATFSGIEDDKKQTTINLKLKEDKKSGYFGKVVGGLGTNKFYNEQVMINDFHGNEKISAYVLANNTGKVALGNSDQEQYSSGYENISLRNNDLNPWNGEYTGNGIPKTILGGLHYSNKWNDSKQSINANYNINDLNISGQNESLIQNNLPTSVLLSKTNENFAEKLLKNTVNEKLQLQLDKTSTIIISLKGGIVSKSTVDNYNSQTNNGTDLNDNGSLLNTNKRNFNTDANNKIIDGELLWLKKFAKERRTLSIDIVPNLYNNHSTGYLNSKTLYFNNEKLSSKDTINQFKDNHSDLFSFSSKAIYTEPLSSNSTVIFNYGLSTNHNSSARNSYNYIPTSGYTSLDTLYSSNYKVSQFAQRAGLTYDYLKGKIHIQLGNDLSIVDFDQFNNFNATRLNRRFVNWFPKASISFNTQEINLNINYQGYNTLPTLEQLLPALNNIDPLNIFKGDIALKPTFTNDLSFAFTKINPITSSFTNIYGSVLIIENPITTSVYTDENGKNIYTYLNAYNKTGLIYNFGGIYTSTIKGLNLDYGFNALFSGNQYVNYSNSSFNNTVSNNYSLKLILSKYKDNLYSAGVELGPLYNTNVSSLQKGIDNNSWGYTLNPNFDLYLPLKFFIHSEADYLWQGKTQVFNEDFHRLIWNSSIGKKTLKNNSLLFQLSANDLLNQNRGFSRNSLNNFISQNKYNTIGRYFMISATWSFSKSNSKKTENK